MKAFVRNNPTLVFGLGLPLLLVLVIGAFTLLSTWLVKPPQYDFIYLTDYQTYMPSLEVKVIDKKIQVTRDAASRMNNASRMWYYSAKTGVAREIAWPALPSPVASNDQSPGAPVLIPVAMPELAALLIDAAAVAPDGYQFQARGYCSSGNWLNFWLSSPCNAAAATLTKQGRRVVVSYPTMDGRSGWIRFVGWVIPQ